MPVPHSLLSLLDPNALPPGLAAPSTEAVATLGEAKTPVVSAEPEPAVAPMPRITPRKVTAAPASTGIPALDAMRAQFDALEAQLRQSPMAQLSSQVAGLAVQLDRIEAALGSVSKLSAALTIRLDEVGLAMERIEESQERMAKQELSGLPSLRSLQIRQKDTPPIPYIGLDPARPRINHAVFQESKKLPEGAWTDEPPLVATVRGLQDVSIVETPATPARPSVEPTDVLAHLTGTVSALNWGFSAVWFVRFEGGLRAFDSVNDAIAHVLSQPLAERFAVASSWETWPGDSWAFHIRHLGAPEATHIALLRDIWDLHGRLFPATVGKPMLVPVVEAAPAPAPLDGIDRTFSFVRRWEGPALDDAGDVAALFVAMALDLPRSATLRVGMHGKHGFCFFLIGPHEILSVAVRERFVEVGPVHSASVAVVEAVPAAKPPDLLDQVLALDWGGPVSWEVRVVGGMTLPHEKLTDAIWDMRVRSFATGLRAVRGEGAATEVTKCTPGIALDEILQLHANPGWQLRSIADAPPPKNYKLGTLHAYRAAAERTCSTCGAAPGYACRKVSKTGKILDVACENPHPTRRKSFAEVAPVVVETPAETPEVTDGN